MVEMAGNEQAGLAPVQSEGLSASVEETICVASLRHFSHTGDFASRLRTLLGTALPDTGQMLRVRGGTPEAHWLLAWRRPGETLALTPQPAALEALELAVETVTDGCLVELTGGLLPLHVRGAALGPLLARTAAANVAPRPGECRTGRLAEVPVTVLGIEPDEVLMLVERAFAPHVLATIRVTARDLGGAGGSGGLI